MVSALTVVRARIADAVLGSADYSVASSGGSPAVASDDASLGAITLRPAQRAALQIVRRAVAEFGGALLADEPGLGKTYVALAFARAYDAALVVAPAALREMWRDAAARAATPVTFVSFETLSRRDGTPTNGCVVVDEAHHTANRAARRYARVARLCAAADVLLVTATPVRNRRAELDALLALIVGPRAVTLEPSDRARIIVRRGATAGDRPAIASTRWHRIPGEEDLAGAIASLPPPVAAVDGVDAAALVRVGLARCWASSLAALDAALRRREQRGATMLDALACGTLPTRAELRRWVLGDDAMQLAFPEFIATSVANAAVLAAAMRVHVDAIRALRRRVSSRVAADAVARAALLRRLRATHGSARIIAFTSFAETADALWRVLRHDAGVALLTGRGARTASGPRPRADILRALGGARPQVSHDAVSLAIATDVLSEGVNLQGASVIVHLDQPWTPAALEQRAGRAARIGAPHDVVHVHAIRPPRGAVSLLRLGPLMSRKRAAQCAATAAATAAEQLRGLASAWRLASPETVTLDADAPAPAVAAASATCAGWIAVLTDGDRARLTSSRGDSPRALLALLLSAVGDAPPASTLSITRALRAVRRAIERDEAQRAAGRAGTRARRALLRRASGLVTNAPPQTRAAIAHAAVTLRAAVARATGAGAEQQLDALCREPLDDPMAWLARCTIRVRAVTRTAGPDSARNDRGASSRPRLVALLILQPVVDPAIPAATTRPSPPPAPPAAST